MFAATWLFLFPFLVLPFPLPVPSPAALEVQGAGICPPPAQVDRLVRDLISRPSAAGTDQAAGAERAILSELPDGLEIVWMVSGVERDRKTVPASVSCAERTEMAAVTLAIWEAGLHPEITLHLDRLDRPSEPPALPVVRTAFDGPLPTVSMSAPAPVVESRYQWAVGAGLAAVGQSHTGLGGRVDVAVGPRHRDWRARVSAVVVGSRTMSVAPGEATWWRASGVAGADVIAARMGDWALVGGAGLIVGGLGIGGAGYGVNRSGWNVDLGVETSLRIEGGGGSHVRPWLGLQAVTWVRRQNLVVIGGADAASLPRLDLAVALGADWRFGG